MGARRRQGRGARFGPWFHPRRFTLTAAAFGAPPWSRSSVQAQHTPSNHSHTTRCPFQCPVPVLQPLPGHFPPFCSLLFLATPTPLGRCRRPARHTHAATTPQPSPRPATRATSRRTVATTKKSPVRPMLSRHAAAAREKGGSSMILGKISRSTALTMADSGYPGMAHAGLESNHAGGRHRSFLIERDAGSPLTASADHYCLHKAPIALSWPTAFNFGRLDPISSREGVRR